MNNKSIIENALPHLIIRCLTDNYLYNNSLKKPIECEIIEIIGVDAKNVKHIKEEFIKSASCIEWEIPDFCTCVDFRVSEFNIVIEQFHILYPGG